MSTLTRRGMLDGHQRGAGPFTAGGKALEEPHYHQQDRCEHPDLLVRRQQADSDRRRTHHQQRRHQHRLAADPVAEVPPHHPADGPGQDPDTERGETGERAGRGDNVEKNWVLKTSGTAVEKMKKSYHSIVVPMELATATRRSCRGSSTAVVTGSRSHSGAARLTVPRSDTRAESCGPRFG